MKLFFTTILICIICTFKLHSQEFNKSVNKDSLLKNIIKELPENKKQEFLDSYKSGSEQTKEFLLLMFSMPKSSKSELIKNIDANYKKIDALSTEYAKLVPANYVVSIEFNPENKIVNTKESIDLKIELYKNKETSITQEWDLKYNSDKLNNMLAAINWNSKTITVIKKMLADAHCVSIENGQTSTIGFARSGLGKYSYILFKNDLTDDQVKGYNNGCEYIFYKKNIVLMYLGGAVGTQCFPD